MDAQGRGKRRSWLLGLGLGLGLALGAVVLAEVLAWPFLRAPLQDALGQSLRRPVRLEAPFGVRLFGPVRLNAAHLVVGPPTDAVGQPDLVNARDVQLILPWSTLWQLVRGNGDRPLEIDTLAVGQLDAFLQRDAQGRANWRVGARTPQAGADAEALDLPRFRRLQVRSGEIRLDDALQQLNLHASVRTHEGSGAEPGGSAAPAGLDVQARGSHRRLPLVGHLRASGVLPLIGGDDAGAAAPAAPVRLNLQVGRTRLTLDGHARDALHLGGLDAAFDLAGPSLAAVADVLGLTLPTTAAFEMRGRLRKDAAVWSAAVASWNVGSSRLRGDFRYDAGQTPPLLSGTLAGARLALVDLGPVIGAQPGAASSEAPSARVLPQREFDIPSLRRMNADVLLRLDRLDLGTPQLESLAPLQGRVRLDAGVLSVQDLLARTSSGAVRGDISVDARSRDTPRWRADLRWGGIDLERFVKVRNPRGTAPAVANAPPQRASTSYVSGQLGGAARVTGSGRSIAAVMASLDGVAGLWVREGRVSHLLVELAGIDLAESLGLLIRGDQTLPLRCAVAQLTLRDGRAVPDTALVDTRDTTLVINGEVSLAKETLALTAKAQPHDFSPVTLRAPLRIGGTFAQPQVSLDKSRIALRVAGAAALALVAPPAALLATIDLGETDRQLCSEAVTRAQASPSKTKAGAKPAR